MNIRGLIANERNGAPIGGAKVDIFDGDTAIAGLTSSADGALEFSTQTDYTGHLLKVVVTKQGFEILTHNVRAEDETDLQLKLKERQADIAAPPEPAVTPGPNPPKVPWPILVGVLVVAGIIVLVVLFNQKPAPVPPGPDLKPAVELALNPVQIKQGEAATLTWSSANAHSVSIPGLGNLDPNGTRAVSPPAPGAYRYTATATDSQGRTAQSAEVVLTVLARSAPDDSGAAADAEILARPLPTLFLCNAQATPGAVFKLAAGALSRVFVRPAGSLHAAAALPDGTLYFVDANGHNLMRVSRERRRSEEVAFTHSTYVRDLDMKESQVYFSEASGARADGTIYRLDGQRAVAFYGVRLRDVGGSWAGNFAFDRAGGLWLSSGNTVPATIFRVVRNVPQAQYTRTDGAITGFALEPSGSLLYVDGSETVFRLTLPRFRQADKYTAPAGARLSDVALGR